MTLSSQGLRRHLYAFAFFDEFGPLYALYAVWFAKNGLSANDISWVYGLWAAVGLVAEVPSGALADRVDRRRLLAVALVLRAAGIATWLVVPSFVGALVGAGLWAIHSALASGTWEALVHDQLAARGHADEYGPVIARVGQSSHTGVVAGVIAATAALWLGTGIATLGWITVATSAWSISLVVTLPRTAVTADPTDVNEPTSDGGFTIASWWRTLTEGLAVAGADALRFRLLALGSVVEGLFILDEYQPLLAHARGADDALVPLFVLAVWAGLLLGGEWAARRPQLSLPKAGWALAAGAAVLLAAVECGWLPALAFLGLTYSVQNLAFIRMDTALQQRTPGHVRATVTSVRAFFGLALNLAAFGVVASLAAGEDPGPGLRPLYLLLLLTGVAMVAALGQNRTGRAEAFTPRPEGKT